MVGVCVCVCVRERSRERERVGPRLANSIGRDHLKIILSCQHLDLGCLESETVRQ